MKRIDYDDVETVERYGQGKERRKPRRKTRRSEFYVDRDAATSSADKFTDPELQQLFEQGKFTELLGELKSGKEATVYLVDGPAGLMAAKVYADLEVRSFKNDSSYREGRFMADERAARAIRSRTRFGLEAQQHSWVMGEYLQLWELYRAGVPVPKPMVGPEVFDIRRAGRVVLMELIGDHEAPAPRLSDIRLDPVAAADAFEQSVRIAEQLSALGRVHGDLSTFNLLWWQGKVILIDLPQVVMKGENPNYLEFLRRDMHTLCKSFSKLGVNADPGRVLSRVQAAAGG